MKVLVGSQNPVKIEAVREAFSRYFTNVETISMDVKSGVPDQPIGEDSFKGAENRALELKRMNEEERIGADLFVGIEGGIKKYYSKWFSFGTVCVMDKNGRMGFGTSPHFELPDDIKDELLKGVELGTIIDRLTGDEDTKQKDGSIGFFTKGRMNRREFYVPGIVVAMVPFLNENLFFKKGYF